MKAEELINQLNLEKHPEGGYFKEMYRSESEIPESVLSKDYSGKRNTATSIYFLLTDKEFSAFHKIKSDEIWYFHQGNSIEIYMLSQEGLNVKKLGTQIGDHFQLLIPKNTWFSAKVVGEGCTLVSCMVAPGFSFDDFELAKREDLLKLFPKQANIVKELSR
ncbi:MAG: cupin domain-containing protein [Sporocytophaga sp.]|uniref:cupin domain-containing protein n=1 Tax=Sporocytophaga sp. TaxID=2231183 RepID=UPI001AFDA5E4|nr:cupin domain-containing protein [Sporocytophaga sp.]MBO9699410.1 cupin domain-containing protein [Sporocytophaga sp.]